MRALRNANSHTVLLGRITESYHRVTRSLQSRRSVIIDSAKVVSVLDAETRNKHYNLTLGRYEQ